jgi:hypothetical protein
MNLKEWYSNCREIRHELQNLQHRIGEVGVQFQKHVDGAHEIPDQNEFDRSKHILDRIKEVDWYKAWFDLTDDLNLGLLHIDRPEQTQTGYMVSHVLGVTNTLVKLATALATEQQSSRDLNQQAKRLWRKYGSARSKVKNDWMSSGKCAFEQLRTIVSIMDGEVFVDPESFNAYKVRPLLPWALLLVMYAPPDLRKDAEYWLRQPDVTNKDFEKDVEPLIRSYLQQAFTELQFLANSRLAHQHLVERYKERCENYDWKNIADIIQRYNQHVNNRAEEAGKRARFEYEDLLTLQFARYLHDNGYAVHYTPRDGVHEPDLVGKLSNELEPIVVEAKVVGQRRGTKQGAPWIMNGLRALLAYLEKYHNDYGVKDGYLIVFRVGDENSPMYTFDELEWAVGTFTILPKIINVGQINKKDAPIMIKREDFLSSYDSK